MMVLQPSKADYSDECKPPVDYDFTGVVFAQTAGRGTAAAMAQARRRSAMLAASLFSTTCASSVAPDARLGFVGLNNTASYSSSVWRALCRRAAAAASSHIHAAVVSASPWNSAWLMSYLTSLGAKAS